MLSTRPVRINSDANFSTKTPRRELRNKAENVNTIARPKGKNGLGLKTPLGPKSARAYSFCCFNFPDCIEWP